MTGRVLSFGGVEFRVTSMSNIMDDSESIEFIADDGPFVAVSRKDDDPSWALHISVDGEVEESVLLAMIAHARQRLA
ncbi:hypothetical protein [Lentzea sp. NBRC 102530]|uniref:hypothetical protein n=1 Tax=Lentzea sp. NBRC 102530 TaxID=3032201 RepID=UPI0024A544D9|nr:hypothetical protein [Lentzea sp. NBRC 102530]GLY52058.1 hypothetical protein Lesp01_57140 [Lentzea sp. NBRC 102530]